ncbi:tyrosine-type recombinase/integrase [Klebsiella aerogenes]|uniref:tyrosine-type recombinase/integrase n=1 Tax=Klebsiella aerogenes TaxID=548 RepID=UPI002D80C1D6|nr:tyrosine-type recombinase/integrase [Klebsiella aerogenes]
MFTTKIPHISHTEKNGFVWRKCYKGKRLFLSLRTHIEEEAISRGINLTLRFTEMVSLSLDPQSMYQALKCYRDEIIRHVIIASLTAVKEFSAQPIQSHKEVVKMSPEAVQELTGHTLAHTKEAFLNANTEWVHKTKVSYSTGIDKFIKWANNNSLFNVEQITKSHIISFKAYMDSEEYAPNTKQNILTRLGSMFKFTVDVLEWIDKNPITGMMYKKSSTIKKKEEIVVSQFVDVMKHKHDSQTYWAMKILYHCGLRVSELTQLTKADYREVDGIKCISINSDGDKTVKNESSVRNIPLNDALLSDGIWEEKPVMKYGNNSVMERVRKAFLLIGLKRSTHCFRHSLSNRLRDTNADDSTRAWILGHTQANITDRVYVTREPLMKMKAALDTTGAMQ